MLIEFSEMNNLKITNTFFKHKPAHTSTWQCPQRKSGTIDSNSQTPRRNPYRNQIDYILVRNSNNIQVHDSRSYGGFTCNSDHKPVIAKINLKWKTVTKPKPSKKINSAEINKSKETILEYQNLVRTKLANSKAQNIQEKWDNIVRCTRQAAVAVVGFKETKKKS